MYCLPYIFNLKQLNLAFRVWHLAYPSSPFPNFNVSFMDTQAVKIIVCHKFDTDYM